MTSPLPLTSLAPQLQTSSKEDGGGGPMQMQVQLSNEEKQFESAPDAGARITSSPPHASCGVADGAPPMGSSGTMAPSPQQQMQLQAAPKGTDWMPDESRAHDASAEMSAPPSTMVPLGHLQQQQAAATQPVRRPGSGADEPMQQQQQAGGHLPHSFEQIQKQQQQQQQSMQQRLSSNPQLLHLFRQQQQHMMMMQQQMALPQDMTRSKCCFCSTMLQFPASACEVQCPHCQGLLKPIRRLDTRCPECGQMLTYEAAAQRIQCPMCRAEFDVSAAPTPPNSPVRLNHHLAAQMRVAQMGHHQPQYGLAHANIMPPMQLQQTNQSHMSQSHAPSHAQPLAPVGIASGGIGKVKKERTKSKSSPLGLKRTLPTGVPPPPKRPVSARQQFAKEHRPAFKERFPGKTTEQVTHMLNEAFDHLPKEKQEEMEERIRVSRNRFKAEKAEYDRVLSAHQAQMGAVEIDAAGRQATQAPPTQAPRHLVHITHDAAPGNNAAGSMPTPSQMHATETGHPIETQHVKHEQEVDPMARFQPPHTESHSEMQSTQPRSQGESPLQDMHHQHMQLHAEGHHESHQLLLHDAPPAVDSDVASHSHGLPYGESSHLQMESSENHFFHTGDSTDALTSFVNNNGLESAMTPSECDAHAPPVPQTDQSRLLQEDTAHLRASPLLTEADGKQETHDERQ